MVAEVEQHGRDDGHRHPGPAGAAEASAPCRADSRDRRSPRRRRRRSRPARASSPAIRGRAAPAWPGTVPPPLPESRPRRLDGIGDGDPKRPAPKRSATPASRTRTSGKPRMHQPPLAPARWRGRRAPGSTPRWAARLHIFPSTTAAAKANSSSLWLLPRDGIEIGSMAPPRRRA